MGFELLNYQLNLLQFVALIVLLKDDTEVKGIISVSKGDTDPQESSGGFFESYCIPSGTVLSLNDSLFVVGRNLGLCKYFVGFVNEDDFDDFVFLSDLNTTFPKHLLPIVQVVSLWLG